MTLYVTPAILVDFIVCVILEERLFYTFMGPYEEIETVVSPEFLPCVHFIFQLTAGDIFS